MTNRETVEVEVSMVIRYNLFHDPVLATIRPSVRVIVQRQPGLSDVHTLSQKSEAVSQIPVLDTHHSSTKAGDLVKVALSPSA
jgi:hypothetical protein